MEVIFVRHGQAETNVTPPHTSQVGADRPLTLEGVRQMQTCARYLGKLSVSKTIQLPTKIYSSPYHRTRQSASIISSVLHLPVVIDERLQEINKGEWTGRMSKRS